MIRLVTRILALSLLLHPLQLLGQTPAAPLKVDSKRLALRTDTLAVYLIRGSDTTRTGSLVDELRMDKNRLVRIYSTTDRVLGNQLDTIVSSSNGLRPLTSRTLSASQIAWLTYSDSGVTGWTRLPNGDSVSIMESFHAVVYDGASFDLIIRASPLAEGFRLQVPSFLVGPNTVVTLTGSVIGTETVGIKPCWVFKANFAGMPVTFWIDKETRSLRRQLMQPRADMSILFSIPSPVSASNRAT